MSRTGTILVVLVAMVMLNAVMINAVDIQHVINKRGGYNFE